MTMNLKKVLFAAALALFYSNAMAYEYATHARLTQAAYLSSKLNSDSSILYDLGIAPAELIGVTRP